MERDKPALGNTNVPLEHKTDGCPKLESFAKFPVVDVVRWKRMCFSFKNKAF